MNGSSVFKRLLETGAQFGELSQKNAERLVSELVKAGDMRRKDAEQTVQRLVERGRATTEHYARLAQAEVSKQLGRLAQRLDEVESRVEEVAAGFGVGSRRSTKAASSAGSSTPS